MLELLPALLFIEAPTLVDAFDPALQSITLAGPLVRSPTIPPAYADAIVPLVLAITVPSKQQFSILPSQSIAAIPPERTTVWIVDRPSDTLPDTDRFFTVPPFIYPNSPAYVWFPEGDEMFIVIVCPFPSKFPVKR